MIQIDIDMPTDCFSCWIRQKMGCKIANESGWLINRRDDKCPLKEQEAREPHYTTLRYLVNGMEVAIQHPECPRCIENGLVLWDAEIEKGQAYCKRCGQAVKWNADN